MSQDYSDDLIGEKLYGKTGNSCRAAADDLGYGYEKSPKLLLGAFIISIALRKMRDSNPRYPEKGIPDFESSAFGHSANLP